MENPTTYSRCKSPFQQWWSRFWFILAAATLDFCFILLLLLFIYYTIGIWCSCWLLWDRLKLCIKWAKTWLWV